MIFLRFRFFDYDETRRARVFAINMRFFDLVSDGASRAEGLRNGENDDEASRSRRAARGGRINLINFHQNTERTTD